MGHRPDRIQDRIRVDVYGVREAQIHPLHRVEVVEDAHGVEDDPGRAVEGDGDRVVAAAPVDHANRGYQGPLQVAMGHSCLERRSSVLLPMVEGRVHCVFRKSESGASNPEMQVDQSNL